MRVEDVMTREVATVPPEATLKQVAAVLVARGVSGVPVVRADGTLVGVVSEGDIVSKEAAEPGGRGSLYAALTAADAMTVPAVTVGRHSSLARAAGLMTDHAVKRLPVVGEGGELVGILSRADLVRAFARSDEEIAREIREELVQHTFWLSPADVAVMVDDGVVTLSGRVETRAEAEILPASARRVAGVVEVRSQLRYAGEQRRLGARPTGR